MISEFVEEAVVEEELCDYEIGAAIDFFLEALPIDVLAFAAFDVAFGESGDADGKTAHFSCQFDQFVCEPETTWFRRKRCCAGGGIAPQCQQIADAALLRVHEERKYLVAGCSDAGEVGHARHAEVDLD